MLSQSDIMRAAIEAGVINDNGETPFTRLETTYFDCGNEVAIRITRNGFDVANRWKRTADIGEVKAWLSSHMN